MKSLFVDGTINSTDVEEALVDPLCKKVHGPPSRDDRINNRADLASTRGCILTSPRGIQATGKLVRPGEEMIEDASGKKRRRLLLAPVVSGPTVVEGQTKMLSIGNAASKATMLRRLPQLIGIHDLVTRFLMIRHQVVQMTTMSLWYSAPMLSTEIFSRTSTTRSSICCVPPKRLLTNTMADP